MVTDLLTARHWLFPPQVRQRQPRIPGSTGEGNAAAFVQGWLRTGDQGIVGGESFLTMTGRLKELINRGGEKVTPGEVEEALLAHPQIRQAAVFAIPYPTLGQEVAAAVVCDPAAGCGRAGHPHRCRRAAERLQGAATCGAG
ncbi:MAG: AMP-binding enzyme [Pseudonocardiaceae bacterium]